MPSVRSSSSPVASYLDDPVFFLERHFVTAPAAKPIALAEHQKRILRLIFTPPHPSEVVFSSLKKSGKTTTGAGIALYVAVCRAPEGSEVICCANDEEQSRSRVFADVRYAVERNPRLRRGARVTENAIALSNGVVIRAIASDYGSAAGSRHALAVFDELWAYTSERSQRLYDELTPIPTLPLSMRLVVSSAGFEGESRTLRSLYERGRKGERVLADLPLYRSGGLLMYWDEGEEARRMPWQIGPAADAYYAEQREQLRPGQYLRLHENRWTAGTEAFVSAEEWDRCVDAERRPFLPGDPGIRGRVFVGVDIGTKHDASAVAAVERDGSRVRLLCHRIWTPRPGDPVEIEATVEEYLRQLLTCGWGVASVRVDPYQAIQLTQRLAREGFSKVEEFPQTTGNLTTMGNALVELLRGGNLDLYPDDPMRRAALQAVAIESARGWRIAKERSRHRVDVIVALAMACHAAVLATPHGGAASVTVVRREPLRTSPPERFYDPREGPPPRDGPRRHIG